MNNKMKAFCIILTVCLLVSACGKGGDETSSDTNNGASSTQKEMISEKKDMLDTSDDMQIEQPSMEEQNFDATKEAATEDLPKETSSDVLEISEKMFLTQINDIYYNFDTYKDKTIIVEGMYTLLYSWDGSERIPGVYRRGPGCCGNDGWGGFFLKYDGELPEENDWVRVTGIPELEVGESFINLYLNVISMEVKEERGAEFVMQ